ncbi:hypothetical protein TRICI_002447 [Trichomonascus ciferrii]|uniref:Uncharacterized protein n=1 Tax=Trichomonascus ciferrii TaxID=44093 RepID=A0A642V7Y9_9ASCO|nr:hypothetical protein TRICI_002447 [Trichomonascus ciferrii]
MGAALQQIELEASSEVSPVELSVCPRKSVLFSLFRPGIRASAMGRQYRLLLCVCTNSTCLLILENCLTGWCGGICGNGLAVLKQQQYDATNTAPATPQQLTSAVQSFGTRTYTSNAIEGRFVPDSPHWSTPLGTLREGVELVNTWLNDPLN